MTGVELSSKEKEQLLEGLRELRALSQETVLLLRLLGHGKYEKAISKVLPSEEECLVYKHSDGISPSRQVAEIAGISQSTVQRWWREWVEKGLGEGVPVKGGERFRAKYTLLELAVAVLQGKVEVK